MAGNRKNESSIWVWLLVHLVMCVPGVGFLMACYWAVSGNNATFRNYFRAYLLICLIVFGFMSLLAAFGFSPGFRDWIQGVAYSIYQLAGGKAK